MNCDWQKDVRTECFVHAEFVPPAMFGEAAWDCLLALYADERRELRLDQLAGLVSLPWPSLQRCLVELERQQLVAGELHRNRGEVRAVLTRDGRDLLIKYLSATSNLQFRHGDWPRLASRDGSGPTVN
jgi:hypothetical protein